MKNFSKFTLIRRGTEYEKKKQDADPHPDLVYSSKWTSSISIAMNVYWYILVIAFGVRNPGYKLGHKYIIPPEMIPELVVPDLKGCEVRFSILL